MRLAGRGQLRAGLAAHLPSRDFGWNNTRGRVVERLLLAAALPLPPRPLIIAGTSRARAYKLEAGPQVERAAEEIRPVARARGKEARGARGGEVRRTDGRAKEEIKREEEKRRRNALERLVRLPAEKFAFHTKREEFYCFLALWLSIATVEAQSAACLYCKECERKGRGRELAPVGRPLAWNANKKKRRKSEQIIYFDQLANRPNWRLIIAAELRRAHVLLYHFSGFLLAGALRAKESEVSF